MLIQIKSKKVSHAKNVLTYWYVSVSVSIIYTTTTLTVILKRQCTVMYFNAGCTFCSLIFLFCRRKNGSVSQCRLHTISRSISCVITCVCIADWMRNNSVSIEVWNKMNYFDSAFCFASGCRGGGGGLKLWQITRPAINIRQKLAYSPITCIWMSPVSTVFHTAVTVSNVLISADSIHSTDISLRPC